MATTTTIYRDCEYCGREFGQPDDPGRKRRFCSNACKQAAYRARQRRGESAWRKRERERGRRRAEEEARRTREEERRREERRRQQHSRQQHEPPPHAGTSRPRTWCGTCNGYRGPHTTHHDDAAHERARRRYDALRRKAASTNYPHEAAACQAKAEQIRMKYGL